MANRKICTVRPQQVPSIGKRYSFTTKRLVCPQQKRLGLAKRGRGAIILECFGYSMLGRKRVVNISLRGMQLLPQEFDHLRRLFRCQNALRSTGSPGTCYLDTEQVMMQEHRVGVASPWQTGCKCYGEDRPPLIHTRPRSILTRHTYWASSKFRRCRHRCTAPCWQQRWQRLHNHRRSRHMSHLRQQMKNIG